MKKLIIVCFTLLNWIYNYKYTVFFKLKLFYVNNKMG
jgi:hypothetical protein